jgi:hypothetical protein
MAKLILSVTKVATSKTDKGTLTSCRLMIDGRSMWLNTDSLKGCKLASKDTQLETDDTLFNASLFEVLKCSNENGTYYKLVPKTAFKLADF